MPRIRKLSPEEVTEIEASDPMLTDAHKRTPLTLVITDDEHEGSNTLPPVPTPRLGSIVRLADGSTGIVLRVYGDQQWTAAELLTNDQWRRVSAASVVEITGKLRGISRIDQPSHHTHGWYVRIGYDASGKHARIARFFSDRSYGGLPMSLQAALLFHAAEMKRTTSAA